MRKDESMRFSKTEPKRQVGFVISNDEDYIETTGLQQKNGPIRVALPDGTQPLQLSSGYISGILGQGGAAVIYEIRNKDLGFQRAVKLLRPNHNSESLQRFLKEFKVCAQLSHPNIPVVHTVGQWQGLPFIEMEKVTGFSLLEMITKFAPLPVALVTAIGISICKVLDYIHHCKYEIDKKHYSGFLHLDLKPSNIMLSDTGLLKILDFGMATPMYEAREGLPSDSSIGTSQYIAPEILFGRATPDARSDIFSLGCILFELITGSRVFHGSSHNEIMGMRQTHSIPSIKKIDHSIPEQLIKLIEQCLSLEKPDRPENALIVRQQLEKIHKAYTSETAEDIIAMYTSKRKYNEPFEIPLPSRKSSLVLYTSGIVSAVCIGSLIFAFLLKRDDFSQVRVSISKSLHTILPFLTAEPINKGDNGTSGLSAAETNTSISDIVDSFQTADFSAIDDFYQETGAQTNHELLDSLKKKWSNRQFDELKTFINKLPPELSSRKEVIIYKLRSVGTADPEMLHILDAGTLNDGEYYFHTARYLYSRLQYNDALDCLLKAGELPSEFIDKKVLGTEITLYKARILTAMFRDNAIPENLKEAITTWQKLLIILKDHPNSPQAREALREKENLESEAAWRGISAQTK